MKKRLYLILEIFIWLLIAGGLIFLGVGFIRDRVSQRPTYEVAFKDVDNLMVGAPVRMMGINVGYVTDVSPVENEAYVTFTITRNNIKIPDGAVINIQFTGLAGSKSIEIIPPKVKTSSKNFQTVEPFRINSLLDVQTKISKSILDSANTVLGFFGSGAVDRLKVNIANTTESSKKAVGLAKDARNIIVLTDRVVKNGGRYTSKVLIKQNENVDIIYNTFSEPEAVAQTKKSLSSFYTSLREFEDSINENNFNQYKDQFFSDLIKINSSVSNINYQTRGLYRLNQNFNNNSGNNDFDVFLNNLSLIYSKENLHQAHKNIKYLKEKSKELNKSL